MNEIFLKQIDEVTPFWLFYSKDSGEPGNIQLSACANNFSIHRGYVSEDGLQCVGVRYEKDGFGCYELYNVGHTLIKCPLKPNPIQKLLGGKKAEEKLRAAYESFEEQLNSRGWKTIPEAIHNEVTTK